MRRMLYIFATLGLYELFAWFTRLHERNEDRKNGGARHRLRLLYRMSDKE